MKTYQLEIKWGVIFTIALILWALLERLVGLHSTYIALHPTLTMLFAIVAIAIYVVALRSIRATRPEFTYKHAFISGGIITLVVTVLSPLTQWFIHHIVTPDFFTNAKKIGRASCRERVESSVVGVDIKNERIISGVRCSGN